MQAHRARLGRAALDTEVKALRASLDLTSGEDRAFDVAPRAQPLRRRCSAPPTACSAGVRHLLAVPAGPLLALPLGVLVTNARPPAGTRSSGGVSRQPHGHQRAASVAALRELRAVAARSPAPQPFIGFGDPAFDGGGATGATSATSPTCAVRARRSTRRSCGRCRGCRSRRDEVRRIAAALGAGSEGVVLGADATERRVRETDLSRYRVVEFATHGLLPGELRCQAEPALALTPPATPTKGEDGLLDASEVATLKLDADWVVLSACNTAGPDGSLGGESLSGLARAFFYAGARALLVSHWAVASGPTVDLTTAMFARSRARAGARQGRGAAPGQAAVRGQGRDGASVLLGALRPGRRRRNAWSRPMIGLRAAVPALERG